MTSQTGVLTPKWYSPAEVAVLLGYGLSKVKMLIATRELRSIKDGKYRRVCPNGSTTTSPPASSNSTTR